MNQYEWLTCEDPERMCNETGLFNQRRIIAYNGLFLSPVSSPDGLVTIYLQRSLDEYSFMWKKTVPPSNACNLIREVVGNPFRKIQTSYYAYDFDGVNEDKAKHAPEVKRFLYPWMTPRVQTFAQGVIESERYNDVPALADLLEEVGCDNEELLRHFRQEVRCPKCMGQGGLEEDTGGVTPWGDWISEWCPCNHCMRTGWLPKPVPCQAGCWALRLLTEELS